jgi:ATP-dependent Clp protease adaptor protein ClpS
MYPDRSFQTDARAVPTRPEAGAASGTSMSTTLTPAEVEVEQPKGADEVVHDRPWIVIVWNDPINLMSYVTLVFQKLFGYSRAKATQLMLQVHNEGKAVVSSGTREKAEYDVARLHAHGLWATMRQD